MTHRIIPREEFVTPLRDVEFASLATFEIYAVENPIQKELMIEKIKLS